MTPGLGQKPFRSQRVHKITILLFNNFSYLPETCYNPAFIMASHQSQKTRSTNASLKGRKLRCRTWNRANSLEPNDYNNDEKIHGTSNLCFSDDGSWFQGNIVPPKHCVFKISGKRIDVIKEIMPLPVSTVSPADSGYHTPPKDHPVLSAGSRQDSLNSSNSSSADADLDPELVRAVMDQWELEEADEDLNEECELYQVNVADFETGINYRLSNVRVIRSNSECEIKCDKLRFKSDKCLRGAMADQVLVRQMGPSFADQNLTVFKGDVTFSYQDQICTPCTVDGSKWCL